MILTITPNPMMERTYPVQTHNPGTNQRVENPIRQVTGKGLNVSRALTDLGLESKALLPCNDFAWGFVGPIVAEEAFETIQVQGPPGFRAGFVVVTPNGKSTAYYEDGLSWNPAMVQGFLSSIEENVRGLSPGLVVLAGSLPPGAPVDLYARICAICSAAKIPVALDAVGPALTMALQEGALLAKINLDEFTETFGRTPVHDHEFADALNDLRDRYSVKACAVTAGSGAAFFAFEEGTYRAVPPEVPVRNPVGSGDSLLAGWLLAHSKGLGPEESVRSAMAAGTANAERMTVAVLDAIRVQELKGQVMIAAIDKQQ